MLFLPVPEADARFFFSLYFIMIMIIIIYRFLLYPTQTLALLRLSALRQRFPV
jgi:hypothetical protein